LLRGKEEIFIYLHEKKAGKFRGGKKRGAGIHLGSEKQGREKSPFLERGGGVTEETAQGRGRGRKGGGIGGVEKKDPQKRGDTTRSGDVSERKALPHSGGSEGTSGLT